MTTSFNCRLPDDLVEAIDTRAATVGISRNEWIVRACSWLVDNAPLAGTGDATDPKAKTATLVGALAHTEQSP